MAASSQPRQPEPGRDLLPGGGAGLPDALRSAPARLHAGICSPPALPGQAAEPPLSFREQRAPVGGGRRTEGPRSASREAVVDFLERRGAGLAPREPPAVAEGDTAAGPAGRRRWEPEGARAETATAGAASPPR